jgi:uncharacterized protein (DUF362 family)
MKDARSGLSRRDLLTASGIAAAAVAARRIDAAAAIAKAPVSPVSIAKVASYNEDLAAQFEKMFDQIGGIASKVHGKTVAMKLNMSGGGRPSGGSRFEGYTAGQTTWVHPRVVLALTTVFGKLGAKRIRILESSGRGDGDMLEDKMLSGGWDVNAIRNAAPLVEFEDTAGLGQGKKYSILKVRNKPYIYPAFGVNHSYEDCDFFVSVGKMKNHQELGITLSMKTLFGITPTSPSGYGANERATPPARKSGGQGQGFQGQGQGQGRGPGQEPPAPSASAAFNGRMSVRERIFHYGATQPPSHMPQEIDFKSNRYEGWRMPRLLTDICGARPIDLSVIDGIETIIGGELPFAGTRPGGKPQLLVVGQNCVCTDAVACRLMGYNPRAGRDEPPFRLYKNPTNHPPEQMIPPESYHQYADNIMLMGDAVGMGSADLSKIEVIGGKITELVYDFEARWKGQIAM